MHRDLYLCKDFHINDQVSNVCVKISKTMCNSLTGIFTIVYYEGGRFTHIWIKILRGVITFLPLKTDKQFYLIKLIKTVIKCQEQLLNSST